jgi:D-threonate/D-erythronate kinase
VLCIIADDLTGACDTGAGFARRGFRTVVVFDGARGKVKPDADVWVFSTESRHLPVEQARCAIEAVARRIPQGTLLYKKIDSTLRGHPSAELQALMDAAHVGNALVAPAFPAQGRTTKDSRQLLDGQPLEQTAFGKEIGSSDLRVIFAQPHRDVRAINLLRVRLLVDDEWRSQLRSEIGEFVYIADAETQADLITLARAAVASQVWAPVLCGSAGLASALADVLTPAPAKPFAALEVLHPGPALVIAGSRHPATTRQVAVASRSGAVVVQTPLEFGNDESEGAVAQLAQAAATYLGAGQDVILTTVNLPESPLGQYRIAKRLGAVAAQLLARFKPAGLVLTGGDIAMAVCTALGAESLQLLGEVQPGIALGCLADGAYSGLLVVTKAGGFGGDDALVDALRTLHGLPQFLR